MAPVPWKFAEKLFLNKGLISGLILSGQGDKQDFFEKKWSCFFCTNMFFDEKNCLPRLLATMVNLPNIAGGLNMFFFNNSEPRH